MRLHKDIWWLITSAVAAVAAAPLLVHGDADVNARRAAAATEIAKLAPAQRQLLDNNLKRYEKLSPAEQDAYRSLHDKVRANPPVAEALETFNHWWPTVSAREQAEIFSIKGNPVERLNVVRNVQSANQNDRLERFILFGRKIPDEMRPKTEDFYRVMDAIEAIAVDSLDLTTVDQDDLDKLPRHTTQRTLALLKKFVDKKKDFSDIVQGDAKKARLADALSNTPFQEFVRVRLREGGPESSGNFVVRAVLVMTLWNELSQEGNKQAIGDSELLAELNKLTSDERDAYYSYSADELRHLLRNRIIGERFGTGATINEFFEMPRWGGGPFGRGGGGGGGNDPRRGGGGGRDGRPDGRSDGPRGDGSRGSEFNRDPNRDNKP